MVPVSSRSFDGGWRTWGLKPYAHRRKGVWTALRRRPVGFILGGRGNAPFVRTQFASSGRTTWRVCMWHKNMHDMRTGGKWDEMDRADLWACQRPAPSIATGHEHALRPDRDAHGYGQLRGRAWPPRVPPIVWKLRRADVRLFRVGSGGPWLAEIITVRSMTTTRGGRRCTRATTISKRGRRVAEELCVDSSRVVRDTPLGSRCLLLFNAGGDPNKAEAYFKTIQRRNESRRFRLSGIIMPFRDKYRCIIDGENGTV